MAAAIRAPGWGSERWRRRAGAPYLIGTLAGAAGTGAALGTAGHLLSGIVPAQVFVLLVAAVAWRAAVKVSSTGWPERRRQIPRWWVHPITPYGSLLAGIVIGSGVFTHIRYAVFYMMLMSLAAAGASDGYISVYVGALYGAITGVAALVQSGDPQQFASPTYGWLVARAITLARSFAVATGTAGVVLVGVNALAR